MLLDSKEVVGQVANRPPNFGLLTVQHVRDGAANFRATWEELPLPAKMLAARIGRRLVTSRLFPAVAIGGALLWLDSEMQGSKREPDPNGCFPPRPRIAFTSHPTKHSHTSDLSYGVSFPWKGKDFFPNLVTEGSMEPASATATRRGGGNFRKVSVPAAVDEPSPSEKPALQRGISESDLEELETRLNHKFRSRELLRIALTPPESRPDSRHNKAFEWCGDALLKMGISAVLLEKNPNGTPRELAPERIAFLMNDTLISLGRELGVDTILRKQVSLHKPKIIANAMEALFYALALDIEDLRVVAHILFNLIGKHIVWDAQLRNRTAGGVKGEEQSETIGRVKVKAETYRPVKAEEVEKRIGYTFRNKEILRLVFIDPSALPKAKAWQTNAEYVWLGKSVIRFCETLLRAYEGDFSPEFGTRLRALGETEYFSAFIIEQLGLHGGIVYGKDFEALKVSLTSCGRANLFRALIGGILADGGFAEAERVYRTLANGPFNQWNEAFLADERRREARNEVLKARGLKQPPPKAPLPPPPKKLRLRDAPIHFEGWGGFGPPKTKK